MRILTGIAVVIIAVTAAAQTKPGAGKAIDLTQVIKDLEGKPLADSSDKDGKPIPITLGDAIVKALEANLPEDANAAGLAKFERDALALRVYKHNSVTLTADEVTMIKERVGRYGSTRLVGVVWRMLDPSLDKGEVSK